MRSRHAAGRSADMRRMLITVVAVTMLAAAAAAVYLYAEMRAEVSGHIIDETGKRTVTIVMTDNGFEPKQIRIKSGTQVIFKTTRSGAFWPASDPHPSHTDYPEFDPAEPIAASSSWSFVFDRVGEWGYHDHIRSYFSGTVYVVPTE